MQIAYLGPAGTFTDDALQEALADGAYEPLLTSSVHDAIAAVARGEADRALVPIENSIEGSIRATLDALADDDDEVAIVGEYDYGISPALIARRPLGLDQISAVLSHPQPLAQCARFLREALPGAEARVTSSTAEAVRQISESEEPWAALGTRSAAVLYGCEVLRPDVADEAGNITRFVWIAARGVELAGDGAWKTSLIFSELGEDHPGALVDALLEFSSREVNLTRIESRPLRQELGRYMFFVDIEGSAEDPSVAAAIEGLRGKAESVRMLGSYPGADASGRRAAERR
jgi:prephenate dehydratase